MSYYNQPKHGEQTEHGIWFDNRPINENSTLDEMLAAAHTPDCDELECKHYNPFNFTLQERTWGELTYHAEYGLWLCETHWAEIEAETQPEIIKIDNGHYQVRLNGDIISNHSSRWGAEQVAQKIASKTYEPPRLTFTAPFPVAEAQT